MVEMTVEARLTAIKELLHVAIAAAAASGAGPKVVSVITSAAMRTAIYEAGTVKEHSVYGPEVSDRLQCMAPVLQADLDNQQVSHEAKLRRNVAAHAPILPGGPSVASMSPAALRRAQRGKRSGRLGADNAVSKGGDVLFRTGAQDTQGSIDYMAGDAIDAMKTMKGDTTMKEAPDLQTLKKDKETYRDKGHGKHESVDYLAGDAIQTMKGVTIDTMKRTPDLQTQKGKEINSDKGHGTIQESVYYMAGDTFDTNMKAPDLQTLKKVNGISLNRGYEDGDQSAGEGHEGHQDEDHDGAAEDALANQPPQWTNEMREQAFAMYGRQRKAIKAHVYSRRQA